MPLLSSTPYGTAGAVNTLVRSLVNDIAQNWATDAILLPYLNAAYLDVQHALAGAGGDEFVEDDILLVLAAVPTNQQDPGTQAAINNATAPPNQLPSNLLVPLKLWERPNGSGADFTAMVDLTNKGGLPSRPQESILHEWEWRTDGLYFVGATQDTQLRLRYQSMFLPLTGPMDIVLIRGAQDCLAYKTAALAGGARGSPFMEQMLALHDTSLELLIAQNVRANARQGVRRVPYGPRQGWRPGRGWY